MTTFITGDEITAEFLNAIERENLESESVDIVIPITSWRYADGDSVNATGAAGDPKLDMGGYGSGTGILEGEDAHGTTKTETVCFDVQLPENYVDASAVTLKVNARYSDSDSGTLSVKTVDAEAYEIAGAGTAGSDICATAAQTIDTTMTEYSFTITPTNLVAGDLLRIFLRIVLTESGGSGAQKAEFGGAKLTLASIKG